MFGCAKVNNVIWHSNITRVYATPLFFKYNTIKTLLLCVDIDDDQGIIKIVCFGDIRFLVCNFIFEIKIIILPKSVALVVSGLT